MTLWRRPEQTVATAVMGVLEAAVAAEAMLERQGGDFAEPRGSASTDQRKTWRDLVD